MNRRATRFVAALALVFLAPLALTVGSGTIAARDQAAVESIDGAFVGMIERDGDHDHAILIAVIADAATVATGERRVRVYLCDGHATWGWFDGAAGPDRFALTAEDGAEVEGELTADGVTGTLTLADGTRLAFAAMPATGPAGLYTLFATEDGAFGVSTSGVALQIRLAGDEATSTFLFPDGRTAETTLPVFAWGTGHFRLVVGATEPVNHARGSSYVPRHLQTAEADIGATRIIGICFE